MGLLKSKFRFRFFGLSIILVILCFFIAGCPSGGGGGDDDDDEGGDVVNYLYTSSGTYAYNTNTGALFGQFSSSSFPACCGPNTGDFQTTATVGSTTMIFDDGDGDPMTWTRNSGTSGDIIGTWNHSENNETYSITFKSNGTLRLDGDCYFDGSGSLSISGNFCGEVINLNTSNACVDLTEIDYDDIEINADYDNGELGIEFETPEMLASNTTFDIPASGFEIEIQGDKIDDCWNDEEIEATSGSVTIVTYDSDRLIGSFNVTLENGDSISGSFNVEYYLNQWQ